MVLDTPPGVHLSICICIVIFGDESVINTYVFARNVLYSMLLLWHVRQKITKPTPPLSRLSWLCRLQLKQTFRARSHGDEPGFCRVDRVAGFTSAEVVRKLQKKNRYLVSTTAPVTNQTTHHQPCLAFLVRPLAEY